MSDFIQVELKERLALVTINNPPVNALSKQVLEALKAAVEELAANKKSGALILTGAGERAFVAGADISAMRDMTPAESREYSERTQELTSWIETLQVPVVAAVNGFALGGGCELAMACDYIFASENASFGQPEVALGLIPGYAGTQRLPRLVGKGRALELILTGDPIPADEALRIGLVNRVVEPAELMPTCRALAAKILGKAPLAVRYALEAVNHGLELPFAEAELHEAALFGLCVATDDMKDGVDAFLGKRAAKFAGK